MIKVIVIQKLKMSSWKETYEDDDDDENGDVEEKKNYNKAIPVDLLIIANFLHFFSLQVVQSEYPVEFYS